MSISHWRVVANERLAPLFADGKRPTEVEIHDAYPFGMRKYTPYKLWLEQVRWWKAGCPQPLPARADRTPLVGQEAML